MNSSFLSWNIRNILVPMTLLRWLNLFSMIRKYSFQQRKNLFVIRQNKAKCLSRERGKEERKNDGSVFLRVGVGAIKNFVIWNIPLLEILMKEPSREGELQILKINCLDSGLTTTILFPITSITEIGKKRSKKVHCIY